MTDTIRVEHVMSVSRTEFIASLSKLPGVFHIGPDRWIVRLAGGAVTIAFEPLAGVRLGGLLQLPRAKVTLDIEDISEPARSQFLKQFEIAFQRGGG